GHIPDTVRPRVLQFADHGIAGVVGIDIDLRFETRRADLEPAQSILHRLLEGAANRHHFTHRFHLRVQTDIGFGEFLEGEARNLGDDVVDRWLERRRRGAAGDFVAQLVERVPDGELGGDFGDREPGRLRCQRRRARYARIHFDDDHAAVLGIYAELDVGAAGFDADFTQHRNRGIAHDLVFALGERLRRGDGDRVAGMHAHGIEVFDRADNDAVVVFVADDLHLVLFPADQRFVDQQFTGRRQIEAAVANFDEFLAVVGDAAARAAHRERGPNDARKADLIEYLQRFFHAVRNRRARRFEPDTRHRLAE